MATSSQIRERFKECLHNGMIENSDIIDILNHLCKILNLQRKTNFANSHKISYNGVKFVKNERIFIDGIEFLIDNN